ncbi:hypothetical protein P0136_02365 [Lentisphaerota bacterium ZTH]|nr:hypothetical protein JYG24_06495 [Lentisphaerota bacterium]WET06845.1 hypothetical protein P0136_02365 [Lentisphaerota bacterium ZTH]
MGQKKKKKKDPVFELFSWLIILPVLGANLYAGMKIAKMAKSLEMPLFGSLDSGPEQLSMLLLANCAVIALLAVIKIK